MKLQQIRNATLKIIYGGVTFLLDPWLQDKGTGFSASAIKPEMQGVKNPLNDLPISPQEILSGVDYCLVTHFHPDHFTSDYLPKDIKILTANKIDREEIKKLGFSKVDVINNKNVKDELIDIEIKTTPGIHGDNEEVALQMGEVNGYLLTGEKETLYIAGDTIFYKEVENTLRTYNPNVIILNCDEATTPKGRLIMNLEDIKSVCTLCPDSKVILTHLDSVNHALLTSEDIRKFVKENKIKNAIIPKNGEWITFE